MPQFQPDQVSFNDLTGYGAWDIGHGREHIQFVQALAAQSPPLLIPDFDFLTMLTANPSARTSIIQTHAQSHVLLRAALGLSGIDLSVVNLDAQDDFYSFLGDHAQDHALIRQALGIQ